MGDRDFVVVTHSDCEGYEPELLSNTYTERLLRWYFSAELEQMLKQEKQRHIQCAESELKAECAQLKNEKDDALTRLSQMMSARLTDNNPNITDLSDQFRPTKLADIFSELYDNEWTDAFDALQTRMPLDESAIIKRLLDVVMEAYKFCWEKVHESWKLIEEWYLDENHMTYQQSRKTFKDHRKKRASSESLWTKLAEEFVDKYVKTHKKRQENDSPDDNLVKYAKACVRVCLLMNDCDPPVTLEIPGWDNDDGNKDTCDAIAEAMGDTVPDKIEPQRKGDTCTLPERILLNTNTFKEYTKKGKYIEYVVWPALFLYKGGPLLAKGVAQGINTA